MMKSPFMSDSLQFPRGAFMVSALFFLVAAPGLVNAVADQTALRFEVTAAEGLLDAPRDGRLLLVLGKRQTPEPRRTLGETGMNVPPVLGRDVKGLRPGVKAIVDQTALTYPLANLAQVPPGRYFVQAVFDYNPDLRLPNAPGNLYSEPVSATVDPGRNDTIKLELTRKVPAEEVPPGDELVKYVKIRSELLSRFHQRPMYLRAGVILPRDYAAEPARHYPLWVRIGGFGTRFTAVGEMMERGGAFRRAWVADAAPRMILLHLDGAGPLGDPYQVNSANNGPYGDAVVRELIPYVERQFRALGQPHARFLDGASTGGWVSLALQVFYPDFFQGVWSQCPDPVDFRSFELINIYRDENAYVNGHGFERPAARTMDGDVVYTVRHECLRERVLGRGDRWELSGKDWGSWNAVFGPRGADGLPKPLWDGRTGRIDRSVVAHWQQYDLRMVLEKNWPALAPKLRGKIRIWVGDADDYFLNNAVHRLDQFLNQARPLAEHRITFGPGQGHSDAGWSEAQILREMAEAFAKAKP
jgi:hypothetical protein